MGNTNIINKMKINKMQYIIGILIVFIILISGPVSAFGIGSAYHEGHPLELSPGGTKEIIFNLQNMAGGEDVLARPNIVKGSEILELIDSGDILVSVGDSIDVKASVSIPADAKVGDTYNIEITFTTVTESEAGTFGFGSSVGRKFNVLVVPTAEERAKLAEQGPVISWWAYLITGIIILIIILVIWFALKKRKKEK